MISLPGRRLFSKCLLALFGGVLWTALSPNVIAQAAINIGDRVEIFTDDYVIDQLSGGAKKVLQKPEPKEVVFTKPERMEFEKKVVFPAAGIDPKLADDYCAVQAMTEELSYAGNEAARRYLNGEIDRAAAVAWLEKYELVEAKRAQKRIDFIEQYRSYVINYNLGEDMLRQYIEAQGGTADQPEKRWQEFGKVISSPRLPSGLKK